MEQSVFLCFAGDDESYAKELILQLGALVRAGAIRLRHRGEIEPGLVKEAVVRAQLDEASVIILLVSASCLEECAKELEVAADRHHRGQSRILPVRLRPCLWDGTPLSGLEALPRDGRAISALSDRDSAWLEVVEALIALEPQGQRSAAVLEHRFTDEIERVYRVREPDADFRRESAVAPFDGVLIETKTRGRIIEVTPIGILDGPISDEDLDVFVACIEAPYRRRSPALRSRIVYAGRAAPDELVGRAYSKYGVELISFGELRGLLDFTGYRAWQKRRLLAGSAYSRALYVPQRFAMQDVVESADNGDALEMLARCATDGGPSFWVVLGEFGIGKTFLMRSLTLRFSEEDSPITPVLLEMHSLEKARSLDALLGQHMISSHGMRRFDSEAFRYMLAEGQILLIFDGFDELALRVSYERAVDHLETILSAAVGRAKVILTSRTQHFLSERMLRTALGDRAFSAGFRLARLERFDHGQIRRFLGRILGDSEKAEARLRLIDSVRDLLGLSANPRMLSFIAELPEEQLEAAKKETGEMTAADLYRVLVERWLLFEYDRAHPSGTKPVLTVEQRWEAITRVALLLWPRTDRALLLSELSGDVLDAVLALSTQPLEPGIVEHQIGSGTLLCRDEGDTFSFMHLSILEWLVAREAAREVAESRTTRLLSESDLTDLMADFFLAMAGKAAAIEWARTTLAQESGDVAVKNAQRVMRRAGVRSAANMAGRRLAGHDFSGQDLRDANLEGAHLSGASFSGANLDGANLSGADLTGAGLADASLKKADLTSAHLSFGNLLGADLTGAKLAGARLRYARLLHAKIDEGALDDLDVFGATPIDLRQPEPFTLGAASYSAAAISPDGVLLVSGDLDGRVILWDLATRRALRAFHAHACAIRSLALSPDGRILATASDDATVRLWDLATGKAKGQLGGHSQGVRSVVFSLDGGTLATGSGDALAKLWDVKTGALLKTLAGHGQGIRGVAFSRRSVLATGSDDGTVRLWGASTGEPLATLRSEDARVLCVAFSPDGTALVAGSDDGTIRWWDTERRKLERAVREHAHHVTALAFSPDGSTLASASFDMTIGIRDVTTQCWRARLQGHEHRVWSVAFSPDSASLVSASSDATLRLWDTRSAELRATLLGHQGSVWSAAFSPDGALLASGSSDASIRLWNTNKGKLRRVLDGHQQRVATLSFSPDGACLASGSSDTTVRLWDLDSGELRATLRGHKGSVWSVAFSPDGALLASGSSDTTIRIWDTASFEARATLRGHSRGVIALAFAPKDELLATGSEDGTVRFWDSVSGVLCSTLRGHKKGIVSLAFSPNADALVTGSADTTLRIWDLSGALRAVISGHETSVTSVAFSPDGGLLASGCADAVVRLWDPASGRLRAALVGHQQCITQICFSPDGRLLASASEDNTLRVWDVAEGACRAVLFAMGSGWVAFRPDGRYRLSGNLQGGFWHTLGLCRFEPGELDSMYSDLRVKKRSSLF